mgnify:CR=1 FL=1
MNRSSPGVSPLRQRMIEDMRMRKLEPKTQEAYIRAVRKLTAFLKRSPDTATVEDLRNFQLHLVDTGTSPITLNATLTGLKFFFDITLCRGELMARMQPVKLPRTVPVVLSVQEAAALLAATRNIKHQAALSVAYGAGLRASEVCRLKVGDVDSQRMALRVEQGKGAKDRYAMLSPVLLERLREGKVYRPAQAERAIEIRDGLLVAGAGRATGDLVGGVLMDRRGVVLDRFADASDLGGVDLAEVDAVLHFAGGLDGNLAAQVLEKDHVRNLHDFDISNFLQGFDDRFAVFDVAGTDVEIAQHVA